MDVENVVWTRSIISYKHQDSQVICTGVKNPVTVHITVKMKFEPFLKKKILICVCFFFLQLNPYQLIIRFFNIFRTYGCNVYILLKFFIYNTFFKNIYKNIKHL